LPYKNAFQPRARNVTGQLPPNSLRGNYSRVGKILTGAEADNATAGKVSDALDYIKVM
jgi:hypothetical protein